MKDLMCCIYGYRIYYRISRQFLAQF